ncbi:MAG: riboflavin synthase [Bacteroidales bacterium]|nr:MAG: riboflavin synthase [Bacteroidales bacterium]
MFSGIVEEPATVVALEKDKENLHITLKCSFTDTLKIDQSISHNGVCLTVVKKSGDNYTVTAIKETLDKTNLGLLKVGDKVNLERSMKIDSLLDGHLVQGHVDQTAVCTNIEEADGSWYFTFEYDPSKGNITVEKGSISVNGVSLTVVNSKEKTFQVAIIPYTYEHTNFHQFKVGTVVNLEFDIVGKYITKMLKQYLESGQIDRLLK